MKSFGKASGKRGIYEWILGRAKGMETFQSLQRKGLGPSKLCFEMKRDAHSADLTTF